MPARRSAFEVFALKNLSLIPKYHSFQYGSVLATSHRNENRDDAPSRLLLLLLLPLLCCFNCEGKDIRAESTFFVLPPYPKHQRKASRNVRKEVGRFNNCKDFIGKAFNAEPSTTSTTIRPANTMLVHTSSRSAREHATEAPIEWPMRTHFRPFSVCENKCLRITATSSTILPKLKSFASRIDIDSPWFLKSMAYISNFVILRFVLSSFTNGAHESEEYGHPCKHTNIVVGTVVSTLSFSSMSAAAR